MDEDDFVFLAATGVEEGEEGRECWVAEVIAFVVGEEASADSVEVGKSVRGFSYGCLRVGERSD